MPDIQLNLSKKLFVPKFYPLLFDYSARWECYRGSAGSAKSYFITQKIIIRCCSEKIKILVCRRYGSTLRNTCFSLFKNVLASWKLTPYVKIRETDFNIKFPNGSEIIFLGLDEETKLLSLDDIGSIFIEEVYEVPKNIVEQLNLRMRSKSANQQIYMAFNPISKNHWLYDFCEVNPPSSFKYTVSTYKDNPFLNDENRRELDEMETRNPNKYRIYGRGEWGIDPSGLVITNFREEAFDPMELAAKGLEHRAGCDLGWVDPSAVVDTLYDRDNKIIYIFNEFYKSGCLLETLANAIKDMDLTKTKLFVDASEPRTIQYFRTQGINAVGCAKGKDSVKTGYQFLQDHLIIVHPKCQNVIMELNNFTYIKSKQTGEWTEDTDHTYSHSIDAIRYAYADIYTQTKLKSINKAMLGL
jgi:phage terminase large subunit